MRRFSVLRFVALALALVGSYAAHCSVSESGSTGLHLVEGVVTPGAMADGSPIRAKTFYANEDIQFYTKISWDPAHGSGGTHQLLYKWYADDTPVLTFGGSKEFSVNPSYWWAFTHASHFSPGHHKVELYMDGALFASDEFDLFAGTRPNEPPEDLAIKATGRALLLKGDTREFDRLATSYRESGERTASGTWKLFLLYGAIDRRWFAPTDAVWDRLQNMSDAWLEEQPASPTAVIVNARLLYWRAWSWRGDGTVNQVAAQSWPHYRELLERAGSVLDQHAAMARQDPEWDALRISIARQQGASSQTILDMASRALDRNPYYYPIHYAAVIALLPEWGGSSELVGQYVRMALEHSKEREGTQAYARIYYYLARKTTGNPLDDLNLLGAKWPQMHQSLNELLQAYPSEFNQDVQRAITCLSGDAPAARALGRGSTGDIVSVAWWDTREARQGCYEWAFEGKSVRGPLLDRARTYLSFLQGFGSSFWSRIRLAALIAVVLIESGFALLARLSRSFAPDACTPGTKRVFNPLEYPRTYRVSPVSNPLAMRLAVWMILLGCTVAYLLTTVPWGDPTETETVMGACVAVSVAGTLMIWSRFRSRVVLTIDSMAVYTLIGRQILRRDDIEGVRRYVSRTRPRIMLVVPRSQEIKWLKVPPVLGEDGAFRLWFDSLPSLNEPPVPMEARA